ncbi:proclotting enzyme-like [Varroa jacobsoni]|uniref:CLIP domain-containing serine protease n=1 Tax=Varroa destructor TaxID=109461 RepID=A0A7M7KZ69_VARDE|nr:proclotting enzyme-like [Varroa destructor]XP_022673068.1 proclotting enzyme-like [Varroa destructor]XP_022673069.1 proclotting enzyme-like [Varroa destructor]XP_022673070.1 proclotting enzyme-like [Varroa destructor]XP_022707070.1 proclotting enzyme-like [Varroa jacobsoni]
MRTTPGTNLRFKRNVLWKTALLLLLVTATFSQKARASETATSQDNNNAENAEPSGNPNNTSDELEERFALTGPVQFPKEDPDTCVSPEALDGLCVEIKFCRQLRRVGLNDLRKYICGFHGSTPLLCCAGLQKSGPLPRPQPGPESKPNGLQRPPRPQFLPQNCGVGALQTNRIVGGREAVPGSYPWIIAVFVEFNNQKIHICGATLVSQRHVVSAAHCFFDGKHPLPYNIFRMRIGDYDIDRSDEVTGTLELNILGYRTHPGYVQKTYLNDISLSFLVQDVLFTKTIGPVCLPYTGFEQNLTNARAIVAGWGYTKYQSGKSNSVLKETDIPVWSMEACAKAFKNELNITDDYLCAGDGEGKTDSCQGDSGGPLIMWGDDGRYYLMGIVSFGKKCATPGYPGAYTRVTKQLEWLNHNF